MKNALPWILVLALAAGAGFLFSSGQKQKKELVQLREQTVELAQLRGELAEAKKAEAQAAESDLNQKEKEELIRLRNAVGVLKKEMTDLSKQAQQAQQSREQLLQAQQAQQAQQQQLQQQNQQLTQQTQQAQADKARTDCINNLRQLDGATQQWALENKQPADAAVTMQHILPYLKNSTAPVCPSGGTYTVNNVSLPPTCSIPGHALPQ
jgi:hypothetical protein